MLPVIQVTSPPQRFSRSSELWTQLAVYRQSFRFVWQMCVTTGGNSSEGSDGALDANSSSSYPASLFRMNQE
jgi:hypothetical protein